MESGRFGKPLSLLWLAALLLLAGWLAPRAAAAPAKIDLADGFDFPVGKPDAVGYYIARGLRLRAPRHFGEDWNGRGGGNSDLGDAIYTIADGVVTFAYDVRGGWGNVVIIRHAYRDPASGQVRYCDSLYGHLDRITTKTGAEVKRGDQVGTMGSNRGMYAVHLHFEIRHNLSIGMHRESVPATLENWADPSKFIKQFRRLNREWRPVPLPTGTYQDYKGLKGL
ncbi:MAG: M23 family metallopeptidase [Akkermansiaceae bacterium]|jgi:murein DD-endopeptidase MepM/ murein hydrolase activator NlpD|nr:M23 family metallopeptidase [Akkermansiaceae bacterium]